MDSYSEAAKLTSSRTRSDGPISKITRALYVGFACMLTIFPKDTRSGNGARARKHERSEWGFLGWV
jgi:hypothetical protein